MQVEGLGFLYLRHSKHDLEFFLKLNYTGIPFLIHHSLDPVKGITESAPGNWFLARRLKTSTRLKAGGPLSIFEDPSAQLLRGVKKLSCSPMGVVQHDDSSQIGLNTIRK